MPAAGGALALRPLRHVLGTTLAVLATCVALVVVSGAGLGGDLARLDAATGRAEGVVEAGPDPSTVLLRWAPVGAAERVDPVALAGRPPVPGTRTQVAYDPADPGRPLIPGAALIVDADRAVTDIALVVVVALLVLATVAWQAITRRRVLRRDGRTVAVRRVRWQSGLVTRSWLETETRPQRWLPVHFDPLLVTLPTPFEVQLHGDPLRDRLVAATVDGHLLVPSGPVRSTEPRGRRTDSPARPDATAGERAARLARWRRQLQADLPLLVPAPFVGMFWAYVADAGPSGWAAASLLAAVLALWSVAVRGSDPS